MSLILTNSYVYDLYKKRGKKSHHEFILSLLSPAHLDIIDDFTFRASEKEQYYQIKILCYKRLVDLAKRVQNKWFTTDPTAKEQTFFYLSKYPDLIHAESLSSQFTDSQSSNISEIEECYPDLPVKRKTFDECAPRTKRAKSDEIYHAVLERAKIEGFEAEPWRYFAYLGQRAAHQKAKKISEQFKNIYEGKYNMKVDEAVALSLREEMQIGRTGYQTLKREMNKYQVDFPSWHNLNKNIYYFHVPNASHSQ